MKKILVIVIVFLGLLLQADDYLDMNFFVEPEFSYAQKNMTNFLLKNISADSIRQINIFGGKILESDAGDSLIIDFLNTLQPHLASPVDYRFSEYFIDFNLLASNIESDSIPVIANQLILADSFKVGIFAVYTPDFSVKNDLPEHVNFEFEIPFVIDKQIKQLARYSDVIIMFSNLSKFIDFDMLQKYEIDAIVSFDYQKKSNALLANRKTKWYSILTNRGKYGKLRIKYSNDDISLDWQELDFRIE